MVFGEEEKMVRKKKKVAGAGLFFLVIFLMEASFVYATEMSQGIGFVRAVPGWNKIEIDWEKNGYLSETQSLVLVRKKDHCPKDLSDGEEIYRGNGSQFEDRKVFSGEKYCYGVGLLELSGSFSNFKASQLAESVGLRKRILLLFESRLNLMILLEVLVLISLALFGGWGRWRTNRAKEK
jgi:hypothetical protein